jgi:hypothetical protein
MLCLIQDFTILAHNSLTLAQQAADAGDIPPQSVPAFAQSICLDLAADYLAQVFGMELVAVA